nr:VWA domain-containing protein [bacterium]
MAGAETLVEFTRELREEGLSVGSTTAADLMTALDKVGLASAADVHAAFRCLTVSSPWQLEIFDRVFARFFGRYLTEGLAMAAPPQPRSWTISRVQRGGLEGDGDDAGPEMETFTGASWTERLSHKDFSELTKIEQAQVRSLLAQMMWRPAPVKSRRRRPSSAGDRPDLRRSLRKCVGPEGDLIKLEGSERKRRPRPILFIADVSGSMERYTEMLLYFAHAARARLGRMETFVFSTRLTRITRQLMRRNPTEALSQVSGSVEDWSGGTRIGECLRSFNYDWSRRVTRGGPVALIVSDGWDRGDPAMLSDEMERLRRTVHRLVWVNPLASREGYSPETRGMRAALPHVDDFLAGGRLSDLATLVSLLESLPERKK